MDDAQSFWLSFGIVGLGVGLYVVRLVLLARGLKRKARRS
jgi:hypothetical protein